MVNPGDYIRRNFHYLKMSQLPSDNSTCHLYVCDDVGVHTYSLGNGNKSRGSHDKEKYPTWKNKNLLLYVFLHYKCDYVQFFSLYHMFILNKQNQQKVKQGSLFIASKLSSNLPLHVL